MMKRAALIISETGLQSLMIAGISTGWVKAWLMSAGATEVAIELLEANTWHDTEADWQMFFAENDKLKSVMQLHERSDMQDAAALMLENPQRICRHYSHKGCRVILMPAGDIAFQRQRWLSLFNNGQALLPMYVRADDSLPLPLEPGVSASVSKPAGNYLNANGLLIEEQVIACLKQQQLKIRTVESCTAGGIAARLCRVPGASAVVDRGWITYSNSAKQDEVGVAADVLEQHGAVSEAVVCAMAEGGSDASHICVAVSGIAGPDGGTDNKPVGMVWLALAMAGQGTLSQCLKLSGARYEIQSRTVVAALNLLLTAVDKLRRPV